MNLPKRYIPTTLSRLLWKYVCIHYVLLNYGLVWYHLVFFPLATISCQFHKLTSVSRQKVGPMPNFRNHFLTVQEYL